MKRTGRLIVSVCLVAACGLAEFTEPVLVDVARSQQPWETIHTNAVSLAWDWDATNAVRAVLDIEGMNGSVTTQFSCATSNWLWRVSETAVPQSEDVYALTLTFYDASDAVVGGLTSRVAIVAGAFGHARVDPLVGGAAWKKVTGNVVLPYDARWAPDGTNAVASRMVIAKTDGRVQTNVLADVSGYMGWKIRDNGWGYGTFGLSLSFDGLTNGWTAELTRPLDGTMIRLY